MFLTKKSDLSLVSTVSRKKVKLTVTVLEHLIGGLNQITRCINGVLIKNYFGVLRRCFSKVIFKLTFCDKVVFVEPKSILSYYLYTKLALITIKK